MIYISKNQRMTHTGDDWYDELARITSPELTSYVTRNLRRRISNTVYAAVAEEVVEASEDEFWLL